MFKATKRATAKITTKCNLYNLTFSILFSPKYILTKFFVSGIKLAWVSSVSNIAKQKRLGDGGLFQLPCQKGMQLLLTLNNLFPVIFTLLGTLQPKSIFSLECSLQTWGVSQLFLFFEVFRILFPQDNLPRSQETHIARMQLPLEPNPQCS